MNTSQPLYVNEELKSCRLGPVHFQLGLLIGLVLVFDGYDLFNAAYAAHYVSAAWHLTRTEIGTMLSSGLVGFALGSLLHGSYADRYGRRTVLLAGLWLASAASMIIAVAVHSYAALCAARGVLGLALGVLMPLSVTYLNEFAPARIANRFSLWFFGIGWAAGTALAGIVGLAFAPRFGWQALYFAGSSSVLLALACHRWLPESPQFLARAGRFGAVIALLARMRPDREAFYRTVQFASEAAPRRGTALGELLAPRYRSTTLLLWSCGWLSLFSSYGLSGWLPSVMIERGEPLGASFLFGSLLMGANAFGAISGGYIADALGNRSRVLACAWLLGSVSMIALAISTSHWLNIVCVAAAGLFVISPQNLLNNLYAASYDDRLRATGVGYALGLARLGAIAGPFIAGVLQQVYRSTSVMFVCLAVAQMLCAALVARLRQATPAASAISSLPNELRART